MNRHLTNDELLDRLYGLGEAEADSSRHVRECGDCAELLRAYESRRAEVVAASPVDASNEFFAGQRRQVYARLEEPAGFQARWAPAALAAGFLLAVSAFLYHPTYSSRPAAHPMAHTVAAHPAAAPRVEISDEQLFSDVYSMEESVEPRAAAPIHALFETAGGEGQQ